MMRTRLRPAHGPDELAAIYATPHVHDKWSDHRLRVSTSIDIGRWLITEAAAPVVSVADLSCGDATIARALNLPTTILGDYAPGYDVTGPIEDTIHTIPPVDLFVLSETLEHLDDPDQTLTDIRGKARFLLLSTPDGETDPHVNPEHYWGWDTDTIGHMLTTAGFSPVVMTVLRLPEYVYDYQIWGCR